jgi:LysM repeat protein
MTNRSHQKAFSLLLLSRERPLTPSEQSFVDGHLGSCNACKAQSEVHHALQVALGYTKGSTALKGHEYQPKLPALLQLVESRRMAQKTAKIVLTISKLGAACVVILALLWFLEHNLPKIIPAIYTQATHTPLATAIAPSLSAPTAYPIVQVTPSAVVNKARTEVITYTVQSGDTIFGIAEKFNLKPETILWGNTETFEYYNIVLMPGIKINILPVDGVYYQWKEGDDLNMVASQLGVSIRDIIDWPGNHLNPDTLGDLSHPAIKPGTMLVVPGGHIDFTGWSETPYPG